MVAEAGLKIFVIAVVGGGGELELLSPTRGVGRFREDDNVADGRCGLWPVVETVHEDKVEGAGVEVVDGNHFGHLGRRHCIGVSGLGQIVDGPDLSIDRADRVGTVAGDNNATVAVSGGARARRVHWKIRSRHHQEHGPIVTFWYGKTF